MSFDKPILIYYYNDLGMRLGISTSTSYPVTPYSSTKSITDSGYKEKCFYAPNFD